MRKAGRMRDRFVSGVVALVLGLGIFWGGFCMWGTVGHAESQAKITTPGGANIRKEASASSAKVGGAENGKVVTVLSQAQDGDGNTWYQVQSEDVVGYIRSDLLEITEGEVPPEGGGEGGSQAPAPEVTAVNPVNATVSSDSGKIRDNASSEGQILAEVQAEAMLTVTGQAVDADGRTWYQVSYHTGDSQVDGFIRYDYVTLAGELTPLTETPSTPEEPEASEPALETQAYYTVQQDGSWVLVDNTGAEPKAYPIQNLFNSVTENAKVAADNGKTVKNQKLIIIVMVFLLVAAAAGIAFLVFKVRDLMDSAYFNEVEKETIRKKTASGDRGTQRPSASSGQARPAGARTSGYTQTARGSAQSQRTGGNSQRPTSPPQGQRPVSPQSRSVQGQPQRERVSVQGQSMGERGSAQGERGNTQGQRPARQAQDARSGGIQGTRPTGAQVRPSGQGQRPGTAQQTTRRPVGASQGQRPGEEPRQLGKQAKPMTGDPQKAQSRNFMAEGDEDDYEFINYDE